MALFTGKGDDGTTYFFGSKERFAKDTPLAEALGTCDELGSLLGYLKARGRTSKRRTDLGKIHNSVHLLWVVCCHQAFFRGNVSTSSCLGPHLGTL